MLATTLVTALGQTVANLPEGAIKQRASVAVLRNGDLDYLAVFTDGTEPSGRQGVALNVIALPLISMKPEEVPAYVVEAVANAAADYRGKQREGLVP